MSKIAQNVTKSNSASATKIGPRKVMRIQGCLGPSWAVYKNSKYEGCLSKKDVAIAFARASNDFEITEAAEKFKLDKKVAKVFWDAQYDEEEADAEVP